MHVERWRNIVWLRLRSLLRRGAVESEMDRELRFHLDREIEQNVSRGMTQKPGPGGRAAATGRRRADSGGMP